MSGDPASPGDLVTSARRERVAVVGSGVSGLTAAYLLSRAHDVTLFEADDRLGGHAHTHSVAGGAGPVAGDSGFIVFNDRTHPVLRRLFAELGVSGRPTEMSMSVRDDRSGVEFAGGRGLPGFVARPGQLARGSYWRMLTGVRRVPGLAPGVPLGRTEHPPPAHTLSLRWLFASVSAGVWELHEIAGRQGQVCMSDPLKKRSRGEMETEVGRLYVDRNSEEGSHAPM